MKITDIEGDRVLFAVCLLSLLGTSFLFLLSASQEPPEIDIVDIDDSYLDTVIITRGYVMDLRNYYGTSHVTVRDPEDTDEIAVLIDPDVMEDIKDKEHVIPGATFSFQGRVEQYGSSIRLRVDSSNAVKLVEKTRSSFIPIDSILENPRWYEGTNIKIRGEVKDLWTISRGTHLILSPLEHPYRRLSCEVDNWYVEDEVVKGDWVVIEGVLEYSQWKGMWVLRSEEVPTVH